jgi:hypothetical protein
VHLATAAHERDIRWHLTIGERTASLDERTLLVE